MTALITLDDFLNALPEDEAALFGPDPSLENIQQLGSTSSVNEYAGINEDAREVSCEDTLKYVNPKILQTKMAKYRNFAVTDWTSYCQDKYWFRYPTLSWENWQESYALYMTWHALSGTDKRFSGGGAELDSKDFKTVYYIPAAKPPTPVPPGDLKKPTLVTVAEKNEAGVKSTVLKGFGQCDYFAQKSFGMFNSSPKGLKGPVVEKISTPGHNWAMVNGPAGNNGNWFNMFYVDMWFLACGVPFEECVCFADEAKIKLTYGVYQTLQTFDPNDAKGLSFDAPLTQYRSRSMVPPNISNLIEYLHDVEDLHKQELNELQQELNKVLAELRSVKQNRNRRVTNADEKHYYA